MQIFHLLLALSILLFAVSVHDVAAVLDDDGIDIEILPQTELLFSLYPDLFDVSSHDDDENIFNRTVGSDIPIIIGDHNSLSRTVVGGLGGPSGGGGGGDDADGLPRGGSPYGNLVNWNRNVDLIEIEQVMSQVSSILLIYISLF